MAHEITMPLQKTKAPHPNSLEPVGSKMRDLKEDHPAYSLYGAEGGSAPRRARGLMEKARGQKRMMEKSFNIRCLRCNMRHQIICIY